MASSLHISSPVTRSIGALRRPYAAPSLIFATSGRHDFLANNLNLRVRKEAVQLKNTLSPVFASNPNSSEGSDDTKTSDSAAAGPPFLTILAGLIVFLGICWIIGSIVMWIVGLIVHPPPLK